MAGGKWIRAVRTTVTTGAATGLVLGMAAILLDPYGTIPFSLPLDKAPISSNQRYSYPAVAQNPVFDSVVIGTSTTRLLEPKLLNKMMKARFANLSMNSGTPYEQTQILNVFLKSRASSKNIVLNIDHVWCRPEPHAQFTERPFPPWLYDHNPWNDAFHMFDLWGIEQSGRYVGYLLGLRESSYDIDGYRQFVPDMSEYDLKKVQNSLYRGSAPRPAPEQSSFELDWSDTAWLEEGDAFRFPDLQLLSDSLTNASDLTHIYLLHPPTHWTLMSVESAAHRKRRAACKWFAHQTIAKFGFPTTTLDFDILSDITREDSNFWDSLHHTTDIAALLVSALAGETDATSDSGSLLYRQYQSNIEMTEQKQGQ